MLETISVLGIETNNLKNIDVSLVKGGINLIIGPSGSGKSSLAYDTIAQIGQHEFFSMFADDVAEQTYKVRQYSNMMVTVPIKQLNHNSNIRSTIGTYFGINSSIIFLFASLLDIDEDFFVLNKNENLCQHCHGIGFTKELDAVRLVDYNVPLCKNPFKCWSKYKGFYCSILSMFCSEAGIDVNKTFRELTDVEKKTILFGESKDKFLVKYRRNNVISQRTTKYFGVLTGKTMMPNYVSSKQFFGDIRCPKCSGKKYSELHEDHKLLERSIGDLMTTPFSELVGYCSELRKKCQNEEQLIALDKIQNFVLKANELGLNHLFLHRSIPTLSGGELQRLRLVQVFGTQLSDLLLILDEPLAGLSGAEQKAIYENVIELAMHHTLIIVDHNDMFVERAKKVIALGEGSGKYGGYLIEAKQFLESQQVKKKTSYYPINDIENIEIKNQVFDFVGIKIQLALNNLNLITGRSGVGKTTLLREYLPQHFDSYEYLSQKPLFGNKNSSVATALDIFTRILNLFSLKCKKDKSFFTNFVDGKGACSKCNGAGYREFGDEPKTRLICKECQGTGFNPQLKKYKVADKSIFDIWELTIDEAIIYFKSIEKNILFTLTSASDLLLGHLKIGQLTSTLSGGENIRVKILKTSKTTKKVIGLDEPFKGLGNSEIDCVAQYLYRMLSSSKTLVVVEHNEQAFEYFNIKKELVIENHCLVTRDLQ